MIDRPDHLKGQLILGIDLGTTKSGVAVWNEALGKVTMLSDEDGHSVIPSVVGWDPDARRWLVGHAARALAVSHPAHVAYSTKRYIGRSFGDPSVRRGREDLAYGLVRGDAARPHDILVELGTDDGAPQRLSPPEVAAMVLRTLRETAAHALRLPLDAVRYAVVTVPAYFNMLQRKATIEAGELAGLTVVDILNEPTAAALAYGADILDPTERRILVFDLGGGTFDVSLLEAWRDDDAYGFFTRVVDGDTRLGGDDVDASIVRWLADEIERRHGRAVRASDRVARARLRVAAESAKAALSAPAVEAQPIDIRGLDLGGGPPIDVHVDLTQAQLEQLAGDVVRRTQAIVSRAVEEVAGLRWDQLHEIVLVGGQALMPAIRRGVEALAGRAPRVDERARLAVALGAGEYARVLSLGHERFHQNSVTNVLALPVGIRLHDDSFRVVVPANVVVPHVSEPFAVSTTEDNQPLIRVEVLQGPRGATAAEECIVLDSLVMEVPPAPAGLPKIDVVFDVQTDGTMKITVTDTRRHRRAEKDIRDTQLTWLDERTAVAGSP